MGRIRRKQMSGHTKEILKGMELEERRRLRAERKRFGRKFDVAQGTLPRPVMAAAAVLAPMVFGLSVSRSTFMDTSSGAVVLMVSRRWVLRNRWTGKTFMGEPSPLRPERLPKQPAWEGRAIAKLRADHDAVKEDMFPHEEE
jgi:hypothetical protein